MSADKEVQEKLNEAWLQGAAAIHRWLAELDVWQSNGSRGPRPVKPANPYEAPKVSAIPVIPSSGNPDVGPRCGECRLGLGVHNPEDPRCMLYGTGEGV